ncbi:MAG: hypothetical protein NVSMB52_08040 [Chloroflexota bacterium]
MNWMVGGLHGNGRDMDDMCSCCCLMAGGMSLLRDQIVGTRANEQHGKPNSRANGE